jgi:predicted patatin/cPLA2 family phospholipase
MTRPKTALLVQCGGMRGAWAAGALAALHELQHDSFNFVVAVSSGACSAAYFVADVFEQGLSIWTKWVGDGRVLRVSNWLRFRPLIDLSYLVDHWFREFSPLPVEAFDRSPTRFEIVLTDCRTGRPVYFQPDRDSVLPALNISHHFYLGGRHEMLNEINADEVRIHLLLRISSVLRW